MANTLAIRDTEGGKTLPALRSTTEATVWDPSAGDPELYDAIGRRSWRPVMIAGFTILFLFFGAFGVWGAFAPLGTGVIVMGSFVVDSNRKVVQHLEGGIVERLLVRDGDLVEEGQPLVILDDKRARSAVDVLQDQYDRQLGARARVLAEMADKSVIEFPEELTRRRDDPDVASVINSEQRVFEGRTAQYRGQINLLQIRIRQTRQEIAAQRAQQEADRQQLSLIELEIEGVRQLYEKGLERRPRLLALERARAGLVGSIENRTALIARSEQSIAEAEYQMVVVKDQYMTGLAAQLREAEAILGETRDKLRVAVDTLRRTVVRAPRSGRVHQMQFHTVGGVIAPGQAIVQIVPNEDRLVLEGRARQRDIDVVKPGLPATVRVTAFSQRTTPMLEGTVVSVSPDKIEPRDGSGEPYYLVRLAIEPASLERLRDHELVTGMNAMAIISAGEQTLLEYVLAPLTRSLDLALRER